MTEEQLSRLFKRGTPDPTGGEWGDDARRRHARRQARTVAVAAAAAVAVIATPLAANLLQDRQPQYATPATQSASASPSVDGEAELPDATAAEVCATAAQSAGDELSEGAVRLWLCGEDVSMGGRPGPSEPLTVGIDEAVAAYNALEKADPNQACTAEYTLAYTVVAEYPADRKAVTGMLHGCRTVGDRQDGPGYFQTLQDLWAAQRLAAPSPTPTVDAAVCGAPDSIMTVAIGDAVAAYLCQSRGPGAADGIELSAELMEAARGDLEANAVDGTIPTVEIPPGPHLVFVNAHGEPLHVDRYPGGLYQWGTRVWRPNPEVAGRLASLGGLPEGPAPEAPPAEWNDTCQDPEAIRADAPPATAEYLTLCPTREGVAEPLDAISDPALVARAIEALTAAPTDDGCALPDPGPVHVVLGSGTDAVSVLTESPCRLQPILELFTERRAAEEMTMFRGGPVCSAGRSLFPVTPGEGEWQSGAVCLDGVGEITLPQELANRVARAAADATADEGAGAPAERRIVLVDADGEPLTLARGDDGSFTWAGPDGVQRWRPTGELAAELDRYFRL